MLDPSAFWDLTNLLAAPPVAQEPPAIVRPHITQGSDRIEATMAPLVRRYRLAVGEWLEQLSARQEMLACGSDADIRAHRDQLDALIADVEETAEDRAKSATRHRKYREAVTEPLRRSNPAVARVYDDTTRILYEMDRELVDRLLEFGLFARATRARVNPGQGAARSSTTLRNCLDTLRPSLAMRFAVEPSFLDELKNLPPDRIKAAMANIGKFMATPDLPSLDFRALQSNPGYFLINAKHGDRIVLRKDGDDLYAAVDVGPHDNVLRRWNR